MPNVFAHPVALLRALLAAIVITYTGALYLEFHPPTLSAEATQYQEIVWEVTSGFSLGNGLQKLGLLLGNIIGGLGIALLVLRARIGLSLLLSCPVFLSAAYFLGSSEAAYPNIENKVMTFLWCICSALWGSTIVFAWLNRTPLFPSRGPQAETSTGSSRRDMRHTKVPTASEI